MYCWLSLLGFRTDENILQVFAPQNIFWILVCAQHRSAAPLQDCAHRVIDCHAGIADILPLSGDPSV